ncbi:L7Ae/L30e/S12e/Gadd45 family ribosomal protein [Alkalibacter mobilis]|uniref:L7Ae/L30e/S12e/Gadd45 family ribosomal protein n=1 Tax=Alkalibacter mobilis TaxID=2787712 RepID=UPI00189CE17E|nr:ribosomal L7Ae/L30e/S12e/Gadd45 family protein [Alkalibacter mobilis]MBF7095798.1 ribosomal L7Ae/L30e/S12e/Gadd45 family protein [Alkalibacter mobilis]
MQKNKLLNFIGICKKSGRIVMGDHMVEKDLNRGSIRLVLVAEDTSERIWNKYERFCNELGIPVLKFSTKEDLGKALGKKQAAVIGFTDENQSRNIMDIYENIKETGGVI